MESEPNTGTNPPDNSSNNPNTKKKALFVPRLPCRTAEFGTWDTVLQYINTPFTFENLSDTGNVTYSWSFGDGSTSNEKNPSHAYSKPGGYPVTLITYFNNQPSDTFVSSVHAMLGIFEIKQTPYKLIDARDVEETSDKDLLTIVYQDESIPGASKVYGLVKTDSLFNPIWWKTFPHPSCRLSSISRNNDGTFILSGNYQPGNSTVFSISKIDKDGNLIWMKSYPGTSNWNTYTVQTSDGGFITTGEMTSSSGAPYTLLIKTDNLGNEMWRYSFDQGGLANPRYTLNLTEVNGVYYVPLMKGSFITDTILVATIDNGGHELFQVKIDTFTTTGVNVQGPVGIAYTNDHIAVYTQTTSTLVFSDPTFTNYRKVEGTARHMTGDNNIFYGVRGDNEATYVTAYSTTGQKIWEKVLFGYARSSNCSPAASEVYRVPLKIKKTLTNRLISLDYGINNPALNYQFISTYLREFTIDGKLY